MISRQEIEEVIKHTKAEGKTLTLYININPESFGEHSRGPLSGLKSIDHALRTKVSENEKSELEENLRLLPELVRRAGQGAKSIVAVTNARSRYRWTAPLQIHLGTQAFWEKGASLIPLLNWMDEYERYVIILADRVKARIFTVYMKEIEALETIEIQDHKEVQRTRASGMDHLLSQMQHQRLADTHASWHFKRAIELLSKSGSRLEFDRLFLAGPKTSAAEIEKNLPKNLKDKLAGRLSLSIHAEPQEVLQAALTEGEKLERQQEKEIVDELITRAYKQDKAVLGLEAVNTALDNGQVARLVYTQAIEKKIEGVSSRVLITGGELEQVRGSAAEILDREGGVGAYLRFRI